MGVCVSRISHISKTSGDVSDCINPVVFGSLPEPAIACGMYVGEEGKQFGAKDKKVTWYDEFVSPRTSFTNEPDKISPSSSGWKAIESKPPSQISSFDSDSESFNSEDWLSYDGLNNRANNRYDIGLNILKAKVDFGADPMTLKTHGARSSLMFSVMANDYDFTKKLVERGVDVNQRNFMGETPLGLAIEMNREKIAHYLRSKGAVEVSM